MVKTLAATQATCVGLYVPDVELLVCQLDVSN